jgi:hypothetical protein
VNEKEQLEKGLEEGEEKKKIKHKNYRKMAFLESCQSPPPQKKRGETKIPMYRNS